MQRFLQHPELYGNSFFLPGNEIGVLLIHGYTASTAEVRPFGNFLASKGYTVAAPLLPGHLTFPQDLNRKKWQDWAESVEQTYQQLIQHCRVIFVGGESMGGLLALWLANRHPEIRAILLFAPALSIRGLERAKWISYLTPVIKKGHGDDLMLWKGYTVNPMKGANQLYLLQQEVLRELPQIRQPVCIFQGLRDQTINPDSGRSVYAGIGSSEKELVLLEKSTHCILLDSEFELVASHSEQFIQAHLKSSQEIQ